MTYTKLCGSLFLLASLVPLANAQSFTETPAQSDRFVDSAGINVHLGYTDSLYYNNFPMIQSALTTLGVRHVRDSAPIAAPPGFYANHDSLASAGIHGIFGVEITDAPSDLASYPALFSPGYFEGYEPPDECDVTSLCGSPWATNLVAFLPTLQANSNGYPVLGPSFASPLGPPNVGDVSASTDIGNMHSYQGGWNPEFAGSWGYDYTNYLSTPLSMYLAGITNPNQPVMATETGYTNATVAQATQLGYPTGTYEPYDANSVSEAIAATYMPRVFLNGWLNGVQRTYLYELLNSPGQDYGLLRGDGSQKPAFSSVSNLLTLLADPGGPFTVAPLSYTVTGGGPTMQHLLLQKRDGSYYLVLWLGSSLYNKFTNTPTPVSSVRVTVTTNFRMWSAHLFRWDNTGTVTKKTLPPGVLNFSVGADIVVARIVVYSS